MRVTSYDIFKIRNKINSKLDKNEKITDYDYSLILELLDNVQYDLENLERLGLDYE